MLPYAVAELGVGVEHSAKWQGYGLRLVREHRVSAMINASYLQMYVCCRCRVLTVLRARIAVLQVV